MSVFNFSGLRSPPRRPIIFPSPTSPFCTSPSQLEEVTLDAETSVYSAGLRSPILATRGRSIKECEEQLSGLRKENFNLKLRIYFLEERMGSNCNMDQEDAVKKNIELMVELESLKKEVQEKQDLLCQAVKAMELEEDEHRKENERKDKELESYRTQLSSNLRHMDTMQEDLQSQVDPNDRDFFSTSGLNLHVDSHELISHLESRIADLEEQLRVEQTDNMAASLQDLQEKLNASEEKLSETISALECKCNELKDVELKMANLEVELLQKDADLTSYRRQLDEKITECKNLHLSLTDMQRLNEENTTMYENECKRNERNRIAIANRNTKIAELESATEKYKTKVAGLEGKLESVVNEARCKSAAGGEEWPENPRSGNKLLSAKAGHVTDGSSLSVRSSPPRADYSPMPPKTLNRKHTSSSATTTPTSSPSPQSFKSKASNNHSAAGDDASSLLPVTNEEQLRAMPAEDMYSELIKYRGHVQKLEQDQLKACRIIQTMLETRKKNGKEIEELQRSLQKRDAVIDGMRAKCKQSKESLVKSPSGEKKSIQERVSELNLTAAAPSSDTERAAPVDEHDPHQLLEQYKQFINELDQQKKKLANSLLEKDLHIEELEGKFEELFNDLKSKENRIVDLEFELLQVPDNDSVCSAKEKMDTGTEKISFWIKELEEKDREIERLEKELAKRTHDLQGVVNKELWQKNREIEKLQKLFDKKDLEIANLKKDVVEYENKLLICSMKIKDFDQERNHEQNEIQEKLNSSNGDRNELLIEVNSLNHQIVSMTKENSTLREELKLSDDLRVETQEVCAMLGKRLEEIAMFLDTLLKQKSVLGFLGHRQNKILRQKVEQSLDLSRNLSLTLHMSADQSLLQLSNISELLNSTARTGHGNDDTSPNLTTLSIVPDDISLTYQNHLSAKQATSLKADQSEVIRVLRAQIDQLKGEIEIRDHELAQRMSLNTMRQNDLMDQLAEISGTGNTFSPEEILQRLKMHEKSTLQCDNSDSESWSEPDRDVSKARIGLDDKALKPKVKMISESTEMDARPVSRTPSKKSVNSDTRCAISQLTEQISQKDDLLSQAEEKYKELQLKYNELSEKYEHIFVKYRTAQDDNSTLHKEYKELDNLYQALQSAYNKEKDQLSAIINERDIVQQTTKVLEEKLRIATEAKNSAENEVILLTGKIDNLESYKIMLSESVESKTKFLENRVNELEVEKSQAQKDCKVAEAKLDEALVEIARITEKLLALEFNHAKSTSTLIDDAEKEVKRRVVEMERSFEEKVRAIEHNAHREVLKIREAAENVAFKYEKEYVEKSEVERLKAMIHELESVQDVLKLTEQKVRQLEASEASLKEKIFDLECSYRNAQNAMQNELDTATFQCSQLQLEKGSVEEERTQLQNQLKQCNEREEMFETQVNDLKNDFAQLKDNFKRQLHAIETEKSHLEVKVSSLESLNAELQNQIIKLQCNPDFNKAQSAPPTPTGRILNMYLSKNQLYRGPNYVNELYHTYQRNHENIENLEEVERIQANSSPDLGIESDQGRFSSLEANIVSVRPLQPSIDLAVSMSENFDQHQRNLVPENCGNDKCNRVVKEMNSENYLLKKKLLKSNKLLEDTLCQLAKANQRKREVEKNICKQIHKTSQVLKIAKANLDSGSDTELVRK